MLYHITEWLRNEGIRFPGSSLFQFISFRVMVAILLSLFITTVYGKRLIRLLQKMQIGESVRDLGLKGEEQKKGTPTMGGLIIIAAILIPTLLLADLCYVHSFWILSHLSCNGITNVTHQCTVQPGCFADMVSQRSGG